jgi:histidinol dehydrogenase
MKTIAYTTAEELEAQAARPELEREELDKIVRIIFDEVKRKGDEAINKYTYHYDGVTLGSIVVDEQELSMAESQVSAELKAAIAVAKANIEAFHAAQARSLSRVETQKGVVCWEKKVGIEKVGLYVPGGSAPLFSSVLMLAIPARLAGCKEIVLCTPPRRDGTIHPAILYAAKLAGVTNVVKAGGIQAVAGMTYGTQSISKVYKIFGPGNQYVTAAKMQAFLNGVAIDMPAGPSEVMVVADGSSNPAFVASDLLSQAEHGADSQVLLVAYDDFDIEQLTSEIARQLEVLPRREVARKALDKSLIVKVKTDQDALDVINTYAPEHLIIATRGYRQLAEGVANAGSVFLGSYTPESAGDYASGTNHTLPTNGFAKAYSGLSLDSFTKSIFFQEISESGLQELGKAIEVMAENEQLFAHKNAVSLRLKSMK